MTEAELRRYFGTGVEALATEDELSVDATYELLKEWYDGYHFSKSLEDVYNPFSVMNALARKELGDYWYQTGTPSILIKILRDSNLDIRLLNNSRASADMLGNISELNINPVALFYQTGYLTFKSYDRSTGLFTLGYPDKEVEAGLLDNVLNAESTHTITSFEIESYESVKK